MTVDRRKSPDKSLKSKRQRMPKRCPSANLKIETDECVTIHLTLQLDPGDLGKPKGVFYASGFRGGSQLEFQMHDACILISMLLQHGYTADMLLPKISQVTSPNGDVAHGSLIGLVLSAVTNFTKGLNL